MMVMFCVCSHAAEFRSCVDNLACTSADPTQLYVSHQTLVGIVAGDEYLCSTEARSGIVCEVL